MSATASSSAISLSMDSVISLRSLSKQMENGVVVVGRGNRFLELPPEGLEFIDWLDQGLSLTEARANFEERFNPFPDEDVLNVVNAFLDCDFVSAIDAQPIPTRLEEVQPEASWFSERWAKALFSKPMLLAWMVITIPAAILWASTPALWPRRADFFWTQHYSLVVLGAMLVWFAGMALHETAHWVACRAKGIDATITWTQRLGFFPMSQTVMHNIWAVPRTSRLIPLAAGMMWDIFSISLALYVLYAAQAGLAMLSPLAVKLLRFYVLFMAMGLTSQFWLFSKMDGYFLLSSLLGQRNLQADTYSWLKGKVARKPFDPPAGGMKFIYIYALITLVWGGLFMAQFISINLVIKLQLLWESFLKITAGSQVSRVDFADGVGVFASQVIYWGLLIYAYIRDTLPNWRKS